LPQEFPEEVLIDAENAAVMPSAAELRGRTDFTKECIYTIDPADAKDHDDAVSVENLDSGFRLGVHIADVSHFVQPGTVVDKEAFERGNSVYLPGTVIPMIPEILSNDLCSLKPNRRRLAHSIVIDFDRRGKMLRWEMHDSLVKSHAKLSYEEVQEFFDGKKPSERAARVGENLQVARQLATILSKRRFSQGSLDFDLPESKIIMNAQGEVLELGNRIRLESHRLVEEFMLVANRAVALEIFRKGQPLLYRVHDKPNLERLNDFSNMMARLGLSFPVDPDLKPIHFARFLERVQGRPDADFINELMLRSMQKAVYQSKNLGHFGLAFTHYAHFTSPIRRYPDLLIHRLLRQLKGGKYPPAFARRVVSVIDNVGEHCSATERVAERAEREAVRVKQVGFMARHVGDEFQGVISGVTGYGFFVRLEGLGAEGLVRLSSLDDDYYQHEDKRYRLIGKRTGRIFRLGDGVRVGVLKVDKVSNEIDLFVVDPDRPRSTRSGKPPRPIKKHRSPHPSKNRSAARKGKSKSKVKRPSKSKSKGKRKSKSKGKSTR
jgi:ribonuclease R